MKWVLVIQFSIGLIMAAAPVLATEATNTPPASAAILPLLGEIRARQVQLDQRESALAERERAHAELEALVNAQLREIAEQRGTIESRIKVWEAQSGERVRQLAKIYSAMKPENAARLLEGLQANLATEILSKMKYKKSAAVLEKISAERALTVSRQVAHPLSFEPADPNAGER